MRKMRKSSLNANPSDFEQYISENYETVKVAE